MKPIEADFLPPSFLAKIKIAGDCWAWTAGKTSTGYGRFKIDGIEYLAHRYSYSAVKGPIPIGLTIDHLCRNRACVNPLHLEAVTMRENVLRGHTITAANSIKTHCLRGHLLEGDNVYIRKGGRRRCQICERAAQKRLRSTDKYKQRHALYERSRRAEAKERRNERV